MGILMMNIRLEELVIYASVFIFSVLVVIIYLRVQKRTSSKTLKKINQAKEDGLFEPVSLHPVVDPNSCIRTGACISACPEKDILGIYEGKATVINASQCIGHGACFHACPTEAITLCIGTEKRGVDLPHVSDTFETNVPGIYIAGELGGMGLIKKITIC
jgi:thioredoxin reductase (NADPH)